MSPESETVEMAARRAGIDVDMIDSNLKLPVSERWRLHQIALDTVLELQQARRIRDPKLRENPAPSR